MRKYIIILLICITPVVCGAAFFPWNLSMGTNVNSMPSVYPCDYVVDENGDYIVDENGDYLITCPDTASITIDGANITINGETINIYE